MTCAALNEPSLSRRGYKDHSPPPVRLLTPFKDPMQQALSETYSGDILQHLLDLESASRPKHHHKHRSRMVTWMAEVILLSKKCDQSYFLSVTILDNYLTQVKEGDIHLVGLTAMFIASKFHDKRPFKLDEVVEKLAHFAFTSD